MEYNVLIDKNGKNTGTSSKKETVASIIDNDNELRLFFGLLSFHCFSEIGLKYSRISWNIQTAKVYPFTGFIYYSIQHKKHQFQNGIEKNSKREFSQ